ncbi:MAG: response regulator [Chloroflexota bacterium]
MFKNTPFHILMIEDNPGDIRLTREVLSDATIPNNLWAVKDGEEALQFLSQTHEFINAPRPDLILLDLNLPRMSGLDILENIKSDENLRTIPVVILTTSQSEQDILSGYQRFANAYITKPVSLDQFNRIIQAVESFWLDTARLPPSPDCYMI